MKAIDNFVSVVKALANDRTMVGSINEDEVLKSLSKASIFCFQDALVSKERVETIYHEDIELPLTLPFENCFFYRLNNIPFFETEMGHRSQFSKARIISMLVTEKAPGTFSFCVETEATLEGVVFKNVREGDNVPKFLKMCHTFDSDVSFADHMGKEYAHLDHIRLACMKGLETMLKRLQDGPIGAIKTNEVWKPRIYGQKTKVNIRKIIVIAERKEQGARSDMGYEIDWSHRWEVRGHWRKQPGRIGRDRDGNPYKDWTWVRPHVKGPEHAELISKTRVVKDGM